MLKISACVITKNEEKNIGRWLDCMRQLADEMIVVDTGSTDATVELAQAAGAKVCHFSWCDDFAAAKNFALEQANGDWILFLDADEYFEPASLPLVRQYILRYQPQRQVIGLMCHLLDFDQDQYDRLTRITYQARIFRCSPHIRYVGSIHETLQVQGVPGSRLQYVAAIRIYHTGYSSQGMRRKAERNLRILQAEAAQHGEKPEQAVYFMDAWYCLQDYGKAAKYARQAIGSERRFVGLEGHAEEIFVSCLLQLQPDSLEIPAVLTAARKKYPQLAAFPIMQGLLFWQKKDYLAAEPCFQKGWELLCSEAEAEVHTAIALQTAVYLYLGKLACMQGNTEQGMECFIQGLQLDRQDENLFQAMYPCIAALAPADIIAFLNGIYDQAADAPFLAEQLRGLRAGPVYLYYAKRSDPAILESVPGYLAAGQYAAAAIRAADCLQGFYQAGMAAAQTEQQQAALALLLPTGFAAENRGAVEALRQRGQS